MWCTCTVCDYSLLTMFASPNWSFDTPPSHANVVASDSKNIKRCWLSNGTVSTVVISIVMHSLCTRVGASQENDGKMSKERDKAVSKNHKKATKTCKRMRDKIQQNPNKDKKCDQYVLQRNKMGTKQPQKHKNNIKDTSNDTQKKTQNNHKSFVMTLHNLVTGCVHTIGSFKYLELPGPRSLSTCHWGVFFFS